MIFSGSPSRKFGRYSLEEYIGRFTRTAGTCTKSSLGIWGGAIGAFPSEWSQNEIEYLKGALRTLPPVFIESDQRGFGLCVVCGKKGVLGRCVKCGTLMHFTCVIPDGPGKEQKCPVCYREVEDDGEAYPHFLDLGAPRRSAARSGAAPASGVAPKSVSRQTLSTEALPPHLIFPSDRSPTDEEAQKVGFPTAKEWYVRTSTAYRQGREDSRPMLEADYCPPTPNASY